MATVRRPPLRSTHILGSIYHEIVSNMLSSLLQFSSDKRARPAGSQVSGTMHLRFCTVAWIYWQYVRSWELLHTPKSRKKKEKVVLPVVHDDTKRAMLQMGTKVTHWIWACRCRSPDTQSSMPIVASVLKGQNRNRRTIMCVHYTCVDSLRYQSTAMQCSTSTRLPAWEQHDVPTARSLDLSPSRLCFAVQLTRRVDCGGWPTRAG